MSQRPETTIHQSPGPHAPAWKAYAAGGPGWRICKWCGLTQRPEEREAEARALWKAKEVAHG